MAFPIDRWGLSYYFPFMDPDTFLSRVERAVIVSGLTPTAFGRAAVNDPKFVFDLRSGRECRRKVRDKVIEFIGTLPRRRPRPGPETEHKTGEAA